MGKTVATNRKARHDYTVEDSFEAGIVLTGTEIKSVREGSVNLQDAYVRIEKGARSQLVIAWDGLDRACALVGATGIAAFTVANSHHSGASGYHVETAAERGLLAVMFANSPSAIAPWGGHLGTFGTNPIATDFPAAAEAR